MFDSANPVANPASIVAGRNYRFTVLTDRLLRYEWASDGQFEDRASTFAINRWFPEPKFRVIDREDELEIITDYFHLTYDKKPFSPTGLVVHFNYRYTEWSKPWRYGVKGDNDEGQKFNLGGTARTLDLCDGRCDMGHGVLSRAGYAALDDSTSMLFDGDFVAARRNGAGTDRIDGYLFCYGHDYKGAIRTLYALSGKQPVLPRFALGNWWSRFYAYHQDEYVQLMDSDFDPADAIRRSSIRDWAPGLYHGKYLCLFLFLCCLSPKGLRWLKVDAMGTVKLRESRRGLVGCHHTLRQVRRACQPTRSGIGHFGYGGPQVPWHDLVGSRIVVRVARPNPPYVSSHVFVAVAM
ncbi:hypothetical protein VTN31DRAFT_3110 [Thermomyces dupontii]|uniref:uncharacterized protein n=1 Tax=Talaromyces thermophilus TaxID=28565 RepID=UPI0037425B1F